MFDFFRKYQRVIFIVITVVIVISFSFFGTYNTIGSSAWREQIAFTSIDGKEVTRADVDEMATFIATDNEDKMLYGGVWGPNFLNDGVITKDFLQTGMAQEIVNAYLADLKEDILIRHEKEKRHSLYTHPQAPFIGTARAWEYFAPELHKYYLQLLTATDPQDIFNSKINLYVAQKSFSPALLKQVLRFQERQNSWLSPDPNLDRMDLSLFGYHTIEDWFGPSFTRLISQFIMNASIAAEKKGYTVSQTEALSDLVHNANVSYQQNLNQPTLGVRNLSEYINEQLRRMNMDQSRAVKIWRQILLARRYFNDGGSNALVDTLAARQFHDFANEGLEIEVSRLPQELQFPDYDSLQKFEVYLDSITSPGKQKTLTLPTAFLTPDEVAKSTPELVQKNYVLEVAELDKKSLSSKVSVKEMWNWEVQDANWEILKKQFPELGLKQANSREERFEVLDGLDPVLNAKIQAFARNAIINQHPEWIDNALENVPFEKKNVGLKIEGGKSLIAGLNSKEQRKAFMALLDKAPLNQNPAKDSPLNKYSADQEHFYRIKVIDRPTGFQIVTFKEANSDGTLGELRNRLLEKYYLSTRENTPLLYQKPDGGWKSFADVRELVADSYFEKINELLQKEYQGLTPNSEAKNAGKDRLASLRFLTYMKQMHKQPAGEKSLELGGSGILSDQWKIQKERVHVSRAHPYQAIEIGEAFSIPLQSFSDIKTPANGDLMFYQVKAKEKNEDANVAISEQVSVAHLQLSYEAQRHLTQSLLQEVQDKGAMSLTYLVQPYQEDFSQEEISE